MRLLLLFLSSMLLFSSTGFSQTELENELLLNHDLLLNYEFANKPLNNLVERASLSEETELLRGTRKDNADLSIWNHTDSVQYTYDRQNIIEEATLVYKEGEWSIDRTVIMEYDSEDKLLVLIAQKKEADIMINNVKINYEYNSDNSILNLHRQSWDVDIEDWVNSIQLNFEYNIDGLRTSQTGQRWTDGQWVNSSQFSYEYPADDVIITVFQSWNSTNMAWQEIRRSKNTTTYDNNDNIIAILTEKWINEMWQNDYEKTFEFNTDNQLTLRFEQEWDSQENEWRNYLREITTFNSSATLTQKTSIIEFWVETGWRKDRKTTSDLTEEGSISFTLRESWDEVWTPIDRTFYYYDLFTDVTELEVNPFNLSISPNPGNGLVNINFIELNTEAAIKLFNTQGQLIYSKVINNSSNNLKLDLSHLPRGSYILQLNTDRQTSTQKMLIL